MTYIGYALICIDMLGQSWTIYLLASLDQKFIARATGPLPGHRYHQSVEKRVYWQTEGGQSNSKPQQKLGTWSVKLSHTASQKMLQQNLEVFRHFLVADGSNNFGFRKHSLAQLSGLALPVRRIENIWKLFSGHLRSVFSLSSLIFRLEARAGRRRLVQRAQNSGPQMVRKNEQICVFFNKNNEFLMNHMLYNIFLKTDSSKDAQKAMQRRNRVQNGTTWQNMVQPESQNLTARQVSRQQCPRLIQHQCPSAETM